MTELTKKTTGFLAEFRQFIARGNVLDMAVGVIIGGAFGKISTSLVNDILMPLLSLLTGGADFSQWQWVLREAVYDAGGNEVRAAVAINYGSFLSTILDFLIIAFAVFCLIKAINRFHRKKEAAPPPPPQPSQEEVLLAEIRDLLKESSKRTSPRTLLSSFSPGSFSSSSSSISKMLSAATRTRAVAPFKDERNSITQKLTGWKNLS